MDPLVFQALEAGPRCFSELNADIGTVTSKVLTHSLRTVEHDGLLSRGVYPEIPPRAQHELAGLGKSLLEPIIIMRG